MKMSNRTVLIARTTPFVALLLSCFYTYDFYKCLSGAIANGFRNASFILPMTFSFLLPVFCFLFYFYDFYVRPASPVARVAFSSFAVAYALVDLVLIFMNIKAYASNHALGVYDSLPSIGLHFPYDIIVVFFAIIALNIFAAITAFRPSSRVAVIVNSVKQRGNLKLHIWEYLLICVLAIIAFVFAGSAIYGTFSSFENAFYDPRYLFMLVWIFVIPMGNLALLVLKPERLNVRKSTKITVLSCAVAVNLAFGLLVWVFEMTRPDFLIHIGKPLFMIAFSVSLPIEPLIILGVMAFSTLIFVIRIVLTAISPEHNKSAEKLELSRQG